MNRIKRLIVPKDRSGSSEMKEMINIETALLPALVNEIRV